MRCYLLGLGSNLEPHKHLPGAITELAHLGRISAQSPVVTTAPVGDTFHHEFCNQLLVLESDLLPGPLKQRLQHIEVKLGREPKNPDRKTKDRTIDIDILATANTAEECRQATLEEPYYLRVQQQWQVL